MQIGKVSKTKIQISHIHTAPKSTSESQAQITYLLTAGGPHGALHHKVQKFSSGTSSPGWSWKKGHKTVVVVVVDLTTYLTVINVKYNSYSSSVLWHCELGTKKGIQPVNNTIPPMSKVSLCRSLQTLPRIWQAQKNWLDKCKLKHANER